MARIKMITRTMEKTTAEVMRLNIDTAEVNTMTFEVTGNYTDVELLTKLKELYETENEKLVHIVSNDCKEVLMGMSEEDFAKYAKELPPRKNYESHN